MSDIKRVAGLLFVVGDQGIKREELAHSLKLPLQHVQASLNEIQLRLEYDPDSPLQLENYSGRYVLVTKADLEEDVKAYAQSPYSQTLSRAAIETLAIIAYRQPITRLAIDEIRGVNSQGMIQKLLSQDLIKEVGRVESPGRPFLYGVTDYFMNYFGLESLEDLPEIEDLAVHSQLASEDLFEMKEWQISLFEEEEE